MIHMSNSSFEKNQWWVNGFNANYQNANSDDLEAYVYMDLSNNEDLYDSIYNSYTTKTNNEMDMTFDSIWHRIYISY